MNRDRKNLSAFSNLLLTLLMVNQEGKRRCIALTGK